MEGPQHGVLRGKIGKIKKSNVNPAWLAQKLLAADIIGEEEEIDAKKEDIPEEKRREDLVKLVMGNGAEGVFEKFVNILSSKRHLEWLEKEIKGKF